MKIDLFTHGALFKHTTKDAAKSGGAVGFAYYLFHGLSNTNEVHVKIADDPPTPNSDVCFLCSFGVDKESSDKGKRTSDKKYQQLQNRVVVPLIHSSYEFRFYKHSLPQLQALNPPLVMITTHSPVTRAAVEEKFPNAKIEVMRLPFQFDQSMLINRSQFQNAISSPARIAGIKGTRKVLDLAQILKDRKFLMAGECKGIDWFRNISLHPYVRGDNVFWIGAQAPMAALSGAAFAIDLTTLWYKGRLEGMRPQYTTLEAINCGCIPIMFDAWKADWHGVYLPSPHKEGAKHVWDKDFCAGMIERERYDFEVARHNFDTMKRQHDYTVVAEKLAAILIAVTRW